MLIRRGATVFHKDFKDMAHSFSFLPVIPLSLLPSLPSFSSCLSPFPMSSQCLPNVFPNVPLFTNIVGRFFSNISLKWFFINILKNYLLLIGG